VNEGLAGADDFVSELRELGFRVTVRTGGDASVVRSSAIHLFYVALFTNACTEDTGLNILVVGVRSLLELLAHSKGSLNIFGYANPDVDALIGRARALIDRPRSVGDVYDGIRLFRDVEQKVLDDTVLIPIWWRCERPNCR